MTLKYSLQVKTRAKTKSEGSLLRFTRGANDETSKFHPPSPAFTHLIVVAEAPFITGVESGGEDGRESESGGEERERSRKCSLIAS